MFKMYGLNPVILIMLRHTDTDICVYPFIAYTDAYVQKCMQGFDYSFGNSGYIQINILSKCIRGCLRSHRYSV